MRSSSTRAGTVLFGLTDVFLAVLFSREHWIDVDYFNGDVAVREDNVDKAAIRRTQESSTASKTL